SVGEVALVPRDVDEAEGDAVALEVSEAEVERDAAPLFLGQAVAVDAGQRPEQRGLAVIDVPGGADEQGCRRAHVAATPPAPRAGRRTRKTVPRGALSSIRIEPSWSVTARWTMARPRPVPRPLRE